MEAVKVVWSNRLTQKVRLKKCESIYAACNPAPGVRSLYLRCTWVRLECWNFFPCRVLSFVASMESRSSMVQICYSEYLKGIRVIMSVQCQSYNRQYRTPSSGSMLEKTEIS